MRMIEIRCTDPIRTGGPAGSGDKKILLKRGTTVLYFAALNVGLAPDIFIQTALCARNTALSDSDKKKFFQAFYEDELSSIPASFEKKIAAITAVPGLSFLFADEITQKLLRGVISDEDKEKLINDVLENCENLQTMKTSIEEAYKCYKEKERFKKRLKEQRMVLIEQLQGLSKVVNDLNLDVYKNATFNEELEELLEKEIKDKRFDIKEVLVAQLTGDDIEVYLEFGTNNTLDRIERVKRIVSDALGYPVTADYAFGSIESTNRFKLIRTNRYGALTKVSGIPKYDNEISGDNYTFGEIENTSYAIICDGMGTGDMASNESKAAIEILEKMLEVNIDRGMTVKTMNNILKTRSSEEIFTTLDLSFMDLYKGRLQFIKSGAPPTFIKRGDEVKVINSLSLPIGILNDVDFNIYEENIEDGDLVIMMSDGVLDCNKDTDSPEKWMKSLIAGLQSQSPQSIADEILKIAKLFSKDEIADDMTVMVTKVWRNSN